MTIAQMTDDYVKSALANLPAGVEVANLLNAVSDALVGGVAGVTFTVGAAHASLVNVAIQLNDEDGNAVTQVCAVPIILFADADGEAVNTIALDTVAIGTDGVLITGLADELYLGVSEPDGNIDIDFTEATATGDLFVGVLLPNGKLVISTAVTFT